ncbi:MAG TPA: hypothetical protein VFW07_04610 [Parafilimonas sp.]|nr:hypothetical protein [Parafilimonas sp.]
MSKNLTTDLPDSERDKKELKQEETIIDLPDVKDIPGQENIHVPDLREMADTTISSDDEEGAGIFDDEGNKDASGERFGAAQELNEDDLIIGDDEELEADLDNEESNEAFDDDVVNVTDDPSGDDSDVTDDEIEALKRSEEMDTEDNENLYRAELDDEDFEGEKLNEGEDFSGDDLDVPGEEEDDADEEIGEEDEENNPYSLGDNE